MPRDPSFYKSLPRQPPGEPEQRVGNAFRITVLWATRYYLAASLLKSLLFPHYPCTIGR